MTPNAIIFAVIAALLLAGALYYQRRRRARWGDVAIAMPAQPRAGLHYVYYMSLPGQTAQVADHTTLVWHAQFYGPDQLQAELQGRPHGLVLDCAPQLMERKGGKSYAAPTARTALAAFFTDLRQRGLLGRVQYLTPMDEPNLFCASEAELQTAMAILRGVAGEFPELAGVRYLCIYGFDCRALWCFDQFDLVGVDNYDQKSETLTRGAHAELMRALLPHQQAMVLPGAAYGQDPAPFVAYAHAEPRCWGVVPFIWCHVPASADKEGWTGLQLQGQAAQERYRQAGMAVLDRQGGEADK